MKKIKINGIKDNTRVLHGVTLYNLKTSTGKYYVKTDNGPVLVHNCSSSPVKVENKIVYEGEELYDDFDDMVKLHKKLLTKGFLDFKIVDDVAETEEFKSKISDYKHYKNSVSSIVVDDVVIISKWVPSFFNVYVSSLSDKYYKKSVVKKIKSSNDTEFPAFNSKHLSILQQANILEFDGDKYRYTASFLKEQEEKTGNELLDDLLSRRECVLHWSQKGEPIFDDHDVVHSEEKEEDYFRSVFMNYFTDSNRLKRTNFAAWEYFKHEFGIV